MTSFDVLTKISSEGTPLTFVHKELRSGNPDYYECNNQTKGCVCLQFRFGVVLDGERGRRPHWKSTEQLLNEAVSQRNQPKKLGYIRSTSLICGHSLVAIKPMLFNFKLVEQSINYSIIKLMEEGRSRFKFA